MKIVSLAGDFGTRTIEDARICPKLMVEIRDNPILQAARQYIAYSLKGFDSGFKHTYDFIEYFFMNSENLHSGFTASSGSGDVGIHQTALLRVSRQTAWSLVINGETRTHPDPLLKDLPSKTRSAWNGRPERDR